MALPLLAVALLMPNAAFALNDWSTPCMEGQCSYDVSNGTVSGSVMLSGSSSAISDITPAAGWAILNCDPNGVGQDIRAVCTGDQATCDHLYQDGAEGTLVRLPQNCTGMPFARVAKEWTHEDQSIPPAVAQTLRKRNAPGPPSVRGIRLDAAFGGIDPSHKGNVSIVIMGSTGQTAGLTTTPSIATRYYSTHRERGLFDSIFDGFSNPTSFNKTKDKQSPIDIDQSFSIFNSSISCPASGSLPAFDAAVNINVEAKAHANVDYGIVAAGTVVPPALHQLALFTNFDATLDGILSVDATAQVTFDTGRIQVFTAGLPGLDIPGIFTLGPSFNVDVEGIATIDTALNMSVDLAYNVNNAKLVFPPDQGKSSGTFAPAYANLKLGASPNTASQASVEAHVIPNIAFGIEVLGGVAGATVNLDLDSSAKLALSLQAGANGSTSTNGMESADGEFSGCVDLSSTLAVKAGADASLFGLFDKSTSVSLFSGTFDLFKKCFGAGSTRKRMVHRRRAHAREIVKRGLTCPTEAVAAAVDIADQAVDANSITAE